MGDRSAALHHSYPFERSRRKATGTKFLDFVHAITLPHDPFNVKTNTLSLALTHLLT